MRKYFPIYEQAVSHIWLCNCSILNYFIYEENVIFFFISVRWKAAFSSKRHLCSPWLPVGLFLHTCTLKWQLSHLFTEVYSTCSDCFGFHWTYEKLFSSMVKKYRPRFFFCTVQNGKLSIILLVLSTTHLLETESYPVRVESYPVRVGMHWSWCTLDKIHNGARNIDFVFLRLSLFKYRSRFFSQLCMLAYLQVQEAISKKRERSVQK